MLPLDQVKIDAMFLHEAGRGGRADAIVRSLSSFAHGPWLETVAEGVESKLAWEEAGRARLRSRAGLLPAPDAGEAARRLAHGDLARRDDRQLEDDRPGEGRDRHHRPHREDAQEPEQHEREADVDGSSIDVSSRGPTGRREYADDRGAHSREGGLHGGVTADP